MCDKTCFLNGLHVYEGALDIFLEKWEYHDGKGENMTW